MGKKAEHKAYRKLLVRLYSMFAITFLLALVTQPVFVANGVIKYEQAVPNLYLFVGMNACLAGIAKIALPQRTSFSKVIEVFTKLLPRAYNKED